MQKYIKKYLPDINELRKKYKLNFLGERLLQPNIWHFSRFSVARGVALGVFVAFLPLPVGHMLLAAFLAFLWSANLPVAVVATFLNNPISVVPLYLLDYELGAWLLQIKPQHHHFHIEFTWAWFDKEFEQVVLPMILGGFLLGTFVAFISYWFVRITWYWIAVYRWKTR